MHGQCLEGQTRKPSDFGDVSPRFYDILPETAASKISSLLVLEFPPSPQQKVCMLAPKRWQSLLLWAALWSRSLLTKYHSEQWQCTFNWTAKAQSSEARCVVCGKASTSPRTFTAIPAFVRLKTVVQNLIAKDYTSLLGTALNVFQALHDEIYRGLFAAWWVPKFKVICKPCMITV